MLDDRYQSIIVAKANSAPADSLHHGISPPSYFPIAFSHPGTWIFTDLPFISGPASSMMRFTSAAPTLTSKSPLPPRSVLRCCDRMSVAVSVARMSYDGGLAPGEIHKNVNPSPAKSMAYCLFSMCSAAFEILYPCVGTAEKWSAHAIEPSVDVLHKTSSVSTVRNTSFLKIPVRLTY